MWLCCAGFQLAISCLEWDKCPSCSESVVRPNQIIWQRAIQSLQCLQCRLHSHDRSLGAYIAQLVKALAEFTSMPGGLFSTPVSLVTYKPPALTVESAKPRLSIKVFTSKRIPYRFRRLYRLLLSKHSPITIVIQLTTIRSDGRVEVLLVTNT